MKRLLAIIAITLATIVHAQPNVEFVIKATPGGPDDTLSRRLITHLEKNTNMNFLPINKPGAGHAIAYSYFENLNGPALIIGDPNIQNHTAYASSERLFTVGEFSNILFVRKDSGIKSYNDFVELSKTREIRFGHGGEGTWGHIAAVELCKHNLRCMMVPYKSGAPGMMDLMGGQIDAFAIISYGTSNFLSSDKLSAIMLFSNNKHPIYNTVPTLPNSLRNIEIKNYIAIFGRNLTDTQKKDITKALSNLDKQFFLDMGLWVK
jgi:tripartite-type tricarboxylate transporter receptor subunit TctC